MRISDLSEVDKTLIRDAASTAETWKVNRWGILVILAGATVFVIYQCIIGNAQVKWQVSFIMVFFALGLAFKWKGTAAERLALVVQEAMQSSE